MKLSTILAAVAASLSVMAGAAHAESVCPSGGTIRFGVVPYEATALLQPAYKEIADLISKKTGCPVQLSIATNYNAEIEAMRAGKLDIAEFGPLGYVLANKLARAEAVATFADKNGKAATYTASIVTWPGSGIKTLTDVKGQSFAYSDPASTSGHLFPAIGLKKAGIDPNTDVRALYAGSHTASFEALRNHKVKAGELNSSQIASAKLGNQYDPAAFVTLWQSEPIPIDPIAIRGDLPANVKARLTEVLCNLDFHELSPGTQKFIATALGPALRTAPQTDAAYDVIRSLVSMLNIDLNKL
ncbi:phosphonate ABC transporter substrate-binding protein [Burkholderia sp. ABCPW 14]|uniref:phosphate/phosphite/phosphonate ABC transporter substrate-binding protein n=1 Tax=Burkholderia sp. ABCPW 14 TaxID=1637860 RepID=UPI000770DD9D|nr:phosphate/phosphite/phosphonate ABC transporter substrate-binding protein [Burkholderia sp. ABCPW 14]KVD84430.1 phosphonate ABC transporter substrate-binding protein [Burkholderia sp. ABCPW 14]